jgi:hypothetical protein
MKIMELFHAIDVEEAREVSKKKNIRQFLIAEWDRLVLHCSNNHPVTVSEKFIDGSFELCFCCVDSPSMESLIFHAARPVYTETVFLKLFIATTNVFTAGKF